jgi:hypothetical protein
MFKKITIAIISAAVVGLLIFGAVNRTLAKNGEASVGVEKSEYSQGGNGQGNADQEQSGDGNGQGNGNQGQSGNENGTMNLLPAVSGDLDENEAAALLYMREEEKLARDVYLALSTRWDLPIFQNISQSEQSHTDAVLALIERYGLADPALAEAGKFTNPDLQALYDTLIARGSQSLSEALKVGASIEEIDILDLENYLAQTDNADIQQVLINLRSGSYNHLIAFTSTLYTQTGEVYQPQYLSTDTYQAILESAGDISGTGGGNGYHGGRP